MSQEVGGIPGLVLFHAHFWTWVVSGEMGTKSSQRLGNTIGEIPCSVSE